MLDIQSVMGCFDKLLRAELRCVAGCELIYCGAGRGGLRARMWNITPSVISTEKQLCLMWEEHFSVVTYLQYDAYSNTATQHSIICIK